jgi:hypothetical protein
MMLGEAQTTHEPPRHTSLIVLSDDRRQRLVGDVVVVATPLDLIAALERVCPTSTGVVVIAGSFAGDLALTGFLRDFYPRIGIAVASSRNS